MKQLFWGSRFISVWVLCVSVRFYQGRSRFLCLYTFSATSVCSWLRTIYSRTIPTRRPEWRRRKILGRGGSDPLLFKPQIPFTGDLHRHWQRFLFMLDLRALLRLLVFYTQIVNHFVILLYVLICVKKGIFITYNLLLYVTILLMSDLRNSTFSFYLWSPQL